MAEQGPLSGQKLGDKYILGEMLGQGGFGAVYQAQHALLGRPQAIKILLEQHFASPKFRERFLREAKTLALLDHPDIVHVDDFGFDGNRAYLVMPYMSGGNLQSILRRGPLPLPDAARYLEQVSAALDYAHARSVVHLDLKPLNLLIHEDGRLLLSDFGLAHLLEQGAIEGSTSLQFGTPTYMAPEHLQGQPERRSDLYALGIILYQMLTGRVPFEGSNAAAIMLKHLMEPPPPLRTVRPELPPALDDMLSIALAKRVEDRYQSAGALLAAFQVALGWRASQPMAGIADVPTRLSRAPLATTIRAERPLLTLENGGATLLAEPGVLGPEQLPARNTPGGLLSKRSLQILSLSTIALLLLGILVISIFPRIGGNAVPFRLGELLTLLTWILGLIRSAAMKTWGWFAMIFFSLLLAILLGILSTTPPFLSLGEIVILVPILLVPLTTLLSSRRS